MPCNCGGGAGGKKVTYVATFSDGSSKSYASEIEAKVAVRKNGGTYRVSTTG
jgi:hypothetical protein